MSKTSIEWTDHSINPIRLRGADGKSGHYCEKVSQGCKNCYSSRFQPRFGLPQFQNQRGNTDDLFFDAAKLEQVVRRKKPTKWFWCDMTDLFGDWVPFEWIAACFGVMAATPWHVHQVLTKRPKRALEWLEWIGVHGVPSGHCMQHSVDSGCTELWRQLSECQHCGVHRDWPLPNVHLGVSIEDQKTADERIPLLLQCPAAVRWVSAEPLLGPLDFKNIASARNEMMLALAGLTWSITTCRLVGEHNSLDWVVVGGESGHGARPCAIEWLESIVDQCRTAGVPVFVKQLGANYCDAQNGIGGASTKQPDLIPPIRRLKSKKGSDPSEWPTELRVREFPTLKTASEVTP